MEILAYGCLLIGALGLIALRGYITENPDFLKDRMPKGALAKIEDFFRPPSVLDEQRGAVIEEAEEQDTTEATDEEQNTTTELDEALAVAEDRLQNSAGPGVSADPGATDEKKVV